MSEFYEATNRLASSCDFDGNATINKNAPSSVQDANAAASSCLANPSAVFTPSAPASTSGASGSGSTGSSGTGSGTSGAPPQAVVGVVVALAFSVLGSALVLV